MSAKQGDFGNRIKKLCVYALLCAVCIIIGYIESLFQLSFIAPGVKIGLSNAVACVLVFRGDVKGAFAVNVSRIVLSSLLFGTPVSFAFALSGGIISLSVMTIIRKWRALSVIGVSALGGVVHNTVQCVVGIIFVGTGVFYYLPILIVFGILSGIAVGFLSSLIIKRIKGEKNV